MKGDLKEEEVHKDVCQIMESHYAETSASIKLPAFEAHDEENTQFFYLI